MHTRWLQTLSVGFLALALGTTGCSKDEGTGGGDENSQEGELREHEQLSDAALEGKLRGILEGVVFISEGESPYVVFEGDAVTEPRLTKKIVREKLSVAVKEKSADHRDIRPTTCRAERLDVGQAIAEGDSAEVPTDTHADDYVSAHHDKQVMIALKTMRSQLKSVVGFTFGTNESGDMDEFGAVLYIYVGISKTTGKLIAIMTEAVYT